MSRKTIKYLIFYLQFILGLILDTGEMKTVRIFFFRKSSFFQRCYCFQKIDDESNSDQSNLKVVYH